MTRNEALIQQIIAGTFGKEVIIREIRGKTVVSDKPDFKERILSKKQELVTEVMSAANDYAQGIMRDENLKNAAQIRLNVTSQRLYTALVSEYWKQSWEKEKKKLESEKKRKTDSTSHAKAKRLKKKPESNDSKSVSD